MAEYIEREALLERIDGIWDCADMVFEPNDKCCRSDDCASCKWRETKNAIRKIAANIPAADVRPVVRGKWKKVGTQMHLNLDNAREQYRELGYPHRNIECLQCSNCRMVSMVDESIRYEFCPHCGADMREES